MSTIKLDSALFHHRASLLLTQLTTSSFSSASSLLFIVGSSDGELSYQKSIALQNWWIGYEFPETLCLVHLGGVIFVTSAKKAVILESLRVGGEEGAGRVNVEILVRMKDDPSCFDRLADMIPKGIVGVIQKESPTGKMVQEWDECLKRREMVLDKVDVAVGMAVLFAPKDDLEVKITKEAADLTSLTMRNYFVDNLMAVIDGGRKVSHAQLAEMLEKTHLDERKRERLKVDPSTNWKLVEWCYPPIIQSGGKYDLKPSAQSNESAVHGGTIVCSFGVRYKSYCSNIARTFLVNPEAAKEANYKFLVEVQAYVLSLLVPGVGCNEVYNKALDFVGSKRDDLKDKFVKNVGFGTGIEFRESSYVLGPKNSRELVVGMIINLTVGFSNIESDSKDSRSRVYSLLLGDTVLVGLEGGVELTSYEKQVEQVSFTFGDESDEEEEVVVLTKRGGRKDEVFDESRRKLHQKGLFEERQRLGLLRYNSQDVTTEKRELTFKKFESYRDLCLPKQTHMLKIVVDRKNETVILPVYGQATPFHISTIKSVSKSDEGESVLLRFNFITPGMASGKKEGHAFEDPSQVFLKTLSFKSTDLNRLSEVAKEIMDLKKDIMKRDSERIEKAGLVRQDLLVEIKGRRPTRISDVFIKPQLEGKRYSGDFEIHTNGIRYTRADQKIDILFSNVKHFFFQPCDSELIVLLHLHLIDPIMIGKKKTKDVQIYREVSDASFDETGNRRRRANYGDEDELAQEQEERKHRLLLNKEFQLFASKVSEGARKEVEVDVPFRDLGFLGVPFRQLVLLQPTTDCLVHLSDAPFLVLSLQDVEIAHLERVQFGLKNFDLVFILKDYTKPVIHINTIPVNQLENVKEWLDSVEIPFTEGPVNLSWPQIMKTILEDPKAFYEEAGGWSFLNPDLDENGSNMEESESEFEGSANSSASSSASDSSSDRSSNSDASNSGSGSGSGSEVSGEESGEDWDVLEKKAMADDMKKRGRDDDFDSSSKKRR